MEQLSGQAAGAGKAERKFTSLQIAGIPVEFPFEPYPCQRDYMESVIKALQQGKNALLESPTGTGKTLCLLCSTLAWRESLKPQSQDPNAAAAAALMAQAGLGLGLGPGGMPLGLGASMPGAGGGPGGPDGGAGGGPGGGKPELPTIIYSSRTHSQLAQVMKELRNSSYKDKVRSTVLSSRQQTCLHPTASKLSGGAANQACKALTAAKKCSWHSQLKFGKYRNAASSLVSSVPDIEELVAVGKAHGVCPFYLGRDAGKDADIVFLPYNYLLDPSTRRTLAESINWNNAVVIFDEAHNVESVSSDSCSFDITAKQLTDAMLEAKRAKEACLERIERGGLAMVDVAAPGDTAGPDYRRLAADMELLLGVLKMLENGLHALSSKLPPPPPNDRFGGDGGGLTRPGSFLFEFLAQFGITAHSLSALNAAVDAAADILAAAEVEAGRTGGKASTVALQHLQSCLNLAFSTLEPLSDKQGAPPAHRGFRVHVHMQRSWGADRLPAPTLSYWCFIPGMAFRRLAALRVRSFLLTSGTISPMETFAAELQMPFPVRLENPHVIGPSQVWVGVLPTGPSGVALNSTFQSRDSTAYKDELGNALVNVARLVPDGLLVFFASYAAMDSAISHWKQNGGAGGAGSTWERITRHKAPVVEPRESAAFQAAIEEFRSRLDDPATQGAVFFAVCRGKVSEGLDFSDRAGRAVVITGIPYAVKNDPKVRLKREVLDEESRAAASGGGGLMTGEGVSAVNGEAWYTNTAMRAVNQALGRVIRHRWDYGAILLADDRFRQPNTQRNMSRWVRDHVTVYDKFGQASASLTKFFKDKASFAAPQKALPGRATHISAFETVAGSGPSTSAALGAGMGGGGGSRGGMSLMETAPAAIDVSGIGALAATGLGGGGAAAVKPRPQAGGGGGKKPPSGGLLGLLRSAPSAVDAVADAGTAAAAPAVALGGGGGPSQAASGSQSGGGGGIGLAAALDSVAMGAQPTAAAAGPGPSAGSSWAPVGVRPGGGGMRPPPPVSRPAALTALASLGGGSGGMGGGGGGAPAEEVVGPRHRIAEHQRRAASESASQASGRSQDDDDPGPGAPTSSVGPGLGPSLTAGGLTRIVLQPVQPPSATAAAAAAASAAAAAAAACGGGSGPTAAAEAGRAGLGADGGGNPDSDRTGGGAGSGAAAAAAAPAPAAKADPKAFMTQLKTDLSPAGFKSFQQLMSAYKTSKDLHAFVDGAVALLRAPATAHLLQGVAAFMPKDQRTWFSNVIAVHLRAAAGAAAAGGGDAGSGGGTAAAGGVQGGGAGSKAGPLGKRPATSDAPAGLGPGPGSAAARPSSAGTGRPGGPSAAPQAQAGPGRASSAGAAGRPGAATTTSGHSQGRPAPGQSQSQGQARAAAAAALGAASASGGSQLRAQLLARPGVSAAGGAAPAPGQERSSSAGRGVTGGGGGLAQGRATGQGQGSAQASGSGLGSSRPAGGAGPQPPPAKRPNLGPSAGPRGPLEAAPSSAAAPSARPGSAALSAATGPANGSGATANRSGAGAGAGGGGGGVLSAAMAECSLCHKRPMANAHEGPCGHLACYSCWAVQLAVHFACKTCGRSMRQKNLTKKYFM